MIGSNEHNRIEKLQKVLYEQSNWKVGNILPNIWKKVEKWLYLGKVTKKPRMIFEVLKVLVKSRWKNSVTLELVKLLFESR